MINTDNFIKRLEIVLEYYALNASSFADKIGVQRSSLSHLLSGRNKPSLDFILKITAIFPDVDLYWILNGTGKFPKNSFESPKNSNTSEVVTKLIEPTPSSQFETEENLFSEIKSVTEIKNNETKKIEIQQLANHSISSEIEKIVFFYRDGTFKIFNPN